MVATTGLSAATIRYHNNTFYLVCTNSVVHTEEGWKLENFIISTTDILAGTWSDPIYFPFEGIDPDLFFDSDGKAYIQGCWTIDRTTQPSCTIKQYELDVTTGKPLSEPIEIWGGYAKHDTEGPHIYKVGNWYYLLVAEGGTFENHLLSIARSKSVSGPYESYENNPILTAAGTNEYIQNTGHGDLFQDSLGQWWGAVLGVRGEDGWPLGRETFLTPVTWPAGGWPAVAQPKLTYEACPIPSRNVDLTEPKEKLDIAALEVAERIHIRNFDPSKYDIATNQAREIKLVPSNEGLSTARGTFTFVGKRQRSLTATVTAALDVSEANLEQRPFEAGLALYKDHFRYASISYDFMTSNITVRVVNTVENISRTNTVPLSVKSSWVKFRIRASVEEGYVFSFATNDNPNWRDVGSCRIKELFVRDFTGPIFGLFAQGGDEKGKAVITFSALEDSNW